jgi:serine/threonine kinase PknH
MSQPPLWGDAGWGHADEPEPDETDTGPLPILEPEPPAPARPTPPAFAPTVTVQPRQAKPSPVPVILMGAAVLVVVAVIGGLIYWLVNRSSGDDSAQAPQTTTPSVSPEAEAQARLTSILPRGYTDDSCQSTTASANARAAVRCVGNTDEGGPTAATYGLAKDQTALGAEFDQLVAKATRVVCPGNIQSPGPWRRNAAPDKVAGMLFCGLQDGRPTVVWSDDANLLISSVQGGPQGPSLEQLYTWWSSHS